jgi:ABC-type multidrug transport system permease subunit
LAGNDKQIRYAYVVTLVGVVLAAVTTAYNAVRSYMLSQMRRASFNPGNFTGNQFGNFTRVRQFANVNPYGGIVGSVMLLGVVIAIIGVVWLGLCLGKSKPPSP